MNEVGFCFGTVPISPLPQVCDLGSVSLLCIGEVAVSRFLPPLGRLRVECKSTAFLQYSSVLATPIVSISRLASLRKKAQDEAFLRFSAFRGLPDHDLQKWPGGGL